MPERAPKAVEKQWLESHENSGLNPVWARQVNIHSSASYFPTLGLPFLSWEAMVILITKREYRDTDAYKNPFI